MNEYQADNKSRRIKQLITIAAARVTFKRRVIHIGARKKRYQNTKNDMKDIIDACFRRGSAFQTDNKIVILKRLMNLSTSNSSFDNIQYLFDNKIVYMRLSWWVKLLI